MPEHVRQAVTTGLCHRYPRDAELVAAFTAPARGTVPLLRFQPCAPLVSRYLREVVFDTRPLPPAFAISTAHPCLAWLTIVSTVQLAARSAR